MEESTADKVLFQEPLVDRVIEQKKHVRVGAGRHWQDLEMYLKQKKDRTAAEQRAVARVRGS